MSSASSLPAIAAVYPTALASADRLAAKAAEHAAESKPSAAAIEATAAVAPKAEAEAASAAVKSGPVPASGSETTGLIPPVRRDLTQKVANKPGREISAVGTGGIRGEATLTAGSPMRWTLRV